MMIKRHDDAHNNEHSLADSSCDTEEPSSASFSYTSSSASSNLIHQHPEKRGPRHLTTFIVGDGGARKTRRNKRSVADENDAKSDLRAYPMLLFFATQSSYLCIVGSLLATTFFEPTKDFCLVADATTSPYARHSSAASNTTTLTQTAPIGDNVRFSISQSSRQPRLAQSADDDKSAQFHSLLFEWGLQCKQPDASSLVVVVSGALFCGAIFGAFVAGYYADRFGRKPAVISSLFVVGIGNALLSLVGDQHKFVAISLFFIIGAACGGYMVVNSVLLIESLSASSTRLLVISFNGWPPGMIGTAALAHWIPHWRLYHATIAVVALTFVAVLQWYARESAGWQRSRWREEVSPRRDSTKTMLHSDDVLSPSMRLACGDKSDAKRAVESVCADENDAESDKQLALLAWEKNGLTSGEALITHKSCNENAAKSGENAAETGLVADGRLYSYVDLFRHSQIRCLLLSLVFCYGATSFISFGLYFSAEVLPGNRNLNLAVMGAGKLAFGALPVLLSRWFGRRPIALGSIGVAAAFCWALIASWLLFGLQSHWLATVLGLTVTATIDPSWKIFHLFSVELFPTPVRNMARAVCNVVARLGSLSGPLVVWLRVHNELSPFWVFATLLTLQWLVVAFTLPETRGQPLPDKMPTKARSKADDEAQLA